MPTIELRWLGGAMRASTPSNRAAPEWPPSPDRLFQALVATAYETDQMPATRGWLEALECAAPQLTFPDAFLAESKKIFVPTNFDGHHKRDERRLPTAYPITDRLAYHWPDVVADETAARLVAGLTHLGRASSLVAARLVANSALAAQWRPAKAGELRLRVPFEGRLRELDAAFEDGIKAPLAPVRAYVPIARSRTEPSSSPWSDVIVLAVDGRVPAWRAVSFADAVRNALLSNAGDNAPAALHGHGDNAPAHLAVVPLPDIGHRYAHGCVLGIAFCFPDGLAEQVRSQIRFTISAMRLVRFAGMELQLERLTGEPPRTLDLRRWCRPARVWHSVTPVIYDVFPRRSLTPERAMARSVVNAGYPEPVAVSVSPFASLQAVEPSAAHLLRESSRRSSAPYSHATVVFDRPIPGPLLVGRERHFGGGLFLPVSDETANAV